jgi:REP element-mobilizing transposase RayT
MPTPLLVVTPSPTFGETIRAALEQTESYTVLVVSNKVPAIVRAEEESCRLAFLDLDLGEQWVEDIGKALRTVMPNMKLFVLAGDELPPPLDGIRPWSLIRKPFHLSEVLTTLARPDSPPPASKPQTSPHGKLPWLNDVNTAAQHLTRLTLESSSQAALITRDNEVWAYAGELSQPTAQEVAEVMSRNWDSETDGDLLRFARLESTRAEHILYATRLGPGMLLGLVFDAETPFGTIRSQAGKLGTLLDKDEPAGDAEVVSTAPLQWTPGPPPEPRLPEQSEMLDEEDVPVPPISNILQDVPRPDPTGDERATGTIDPDATRRSVLARQHQGSSSGRGGEQARIASPSVEETVLSRPRRDVEQKPPAARSIATPPQAGEVEATLPHSLVGFAGPGADARRVTLEPVHAGVYHLTYACLLLPRFGEHYLTGEVADKLSEWMPIICVAFGWRLEYLAVRPEYLQWVANVPPATSPGYVMRIMRQQTSERIFGAFPGLKKDNPSGDFWAPGYLIMGGNQPHPSQLVKDYIKQVRQRQGSEKPRRQ